MKHWIQTRGVVQRKRQESRQEQIARPTRALNLDRLKQFAVEHREGLAILAKNDGPVTGR